MALITLTSDQITAIQRYLDLQGIIKQDASASETYTTEGISHRDELASLTASYLTAVATYRSLSGLNKQQALGNSQDADTPANRNEQARIMAALPKVDIEHLAFSAPWEYDDAVRR